MTGYPKSLFFCLATIFCRFHSIEAAAGPTKFHQKVPMTFSRYSTQGLPDDLIVTKPLWEVERQATSKRLGTTTRLYDNGQLYTWSNTRRIVLNGKPGREDAPYLWRLDAQLKPEGMVKIRELIQSEFKKLLSNPSTKAGVDQGIEIRKSYIDGIEHQLVLPTSARKELPQVIQDIDQVIQSNILPVGG